MEEKKKKFITYNRILLAYACVWVIVSVVVSVKLWNALAGYQSNYDDAKEKSNPDLVVEQMLHLYNEDEIYDDNLLVGISKFEFEDSKVEQVISLVKEKVITYVRNDSFKDRKPTYDILADGNVIGKMELKQKQESDSYGFHLCEMTNNEVFFETPELINIKISVYAGDKVYVNDQLVTDDYKVETKKNTSLIAQKATELTGVDFEKEEYTVEGFLKEPKVEVEHKGSKTVLSINEDGCYDFDASADPEFVKSVTELVIAAGEAYIKNTNQMAPFNTISQYLESGSKAYSTVMSVQSGLTWAGKPDELNINSSEILDLKQYSNEVFTVKTLYTTHRLYRNEVYDEEMTYEWLYVRVGDKWLIREFSLAK